MKVFIWYLPIIFIFHDMEEIIGFGIWAKKNKPYFEKKYPTVLRMMSGFSTEGFALGVYEELILCILICIGTVCVNNTVGYAIWLGILVAMDLHFVIHIGQSALLKQCIPSLITSVISLPISTYIIVTCFKQMGTVGVFEMIGILCGIIIVPLNLILSHKIIRYSTKKMGFETFF